MLKYIVSVAAITTALALSGCNKKEVAAPEPQVEAVTSEMEAMPSGDQPQGSDIKVSPNLQEPGMGQAPMENTAPAQVPAAEPAPAQ